MDKIGQYLSILDILGQYRKIFVNISQYLLIYNNINAYLAIPLRLCCFETFWILYIYLSVLPAPVLEELSLLKITKLITFDLGLVLFYFISFYYFILFCFIFFFSFFYIILQTNKQTPVVIELLCN